MAVNAKGILKLLLLAALLAPLFSLHGCGCGFDCNSSDDDDNSPAFLTLSLSDALPEDLSEVVIEIDTITLKRSSGDVVFDTFTVDSDSVETVQIDLLDYRGIKRLELVSDFELEAGRYSSVELDIIDGDVNNSYVTEIGSDERLPLDTASNFSLPGFTVVSGKQEYVIEFGLSRALSQTNTGNYHLSTEGVRVQNLATATQLSGQVDASLFDTASPCDEKDEPREGNRVYLYQGQDLDQETLADTFTSDSNNEIPGDATAPFAVTDVFENERSGTWEYVFGYLPAGDYTLAFSCNTAEDDAIDYDDLEIPLPADQISAFTLEEGETYTCNLTADGVCQ